jgi:hypothetical protein
VAVDEAATSVTASLGFLSGDAVARARRDGPRSVDFRAPMLGAPLASERVACVIRDARAAVAGLDLSHAGFELFHRPSAVADWFDADEVMTTYYEECKALARELTGATQAYTFDHLIREPGKQTAGGGLPGVAAARVTGAERGGGYVGGVHMDYTEHSTWTDYLALHGVRAPEYPKRVVALNFWRPLFDVVEGNPLAVCDARSVRADDLLETMIFGYGDAGYSWHNIGVAVYEVAASPEQHWYYYSRMTPDEVLVMKSYDSTGVIGKACPHASFANPLAAPGAAPRRSIELRVLCFVGGS